MLLKVIVYLEPMIIGVGLVIHWIVHHQNESLLRKAILFMFFIYGISVFYLTLFPIPYDRASLAYIQSFGYSKGMINLIPFKTSMSLKQAFLNGIMLMPLGVMLPLVDQTMKSKKIVGILILTPLMIEVIQGLGSWLIQGLWKQADINDFLLNATGALVGYLCYLVLMKLFPSLKTFISR